MKMPPACILPRQGNTEYIMTGNDVFLPKTNVHFLLSTEKIRKTIYPNLHVSILAESA